MQRSQMNNKEHGHYAASNIISEAFISDNRTIQLLSRHRVLRHCLSSSNASKWHTISCGHSIIATHTLPMPPRPPHLPHATKNIFFTYYLGKIQAVTWQTAYDGKLHWLRHTLQIAFPSLIFVTLADDDMVQSIRHRSHSPSTWSSWMPTLSSPLKWSQPTNKSHNTSRTWTVFPARQPNEPKRLVSLAVQKIPYGHITVGICQKIGGKHSPKDTL